MSRCVCARVWECACMGARCNKHVRTNLREPPGGLVTVVFSCALATFEMQGRRVFSLPLSHWHTYTVNMLHQHVIRTSTRLQTPPTDFDIHTYCTHLIPVFPTWPDYDDHTHCALISLIQKYCHSQYLLQHFSSTVCERDYESRKMTLLSRIKFIYVTILLWFVFVSFRDVKPDNILLDEQGNNVNCLFCVLVHVCVLVCEPDMSYGKIQHLF